MRNQIHSQSSISIFKACPYLYKLKYIDKIFFEEKSEAIEFGKELHLALERYFRGIENFSSFVSEEIKNYVENIINDIDCGNSKYYPEKSLYFRVLDENFLVKCDLIEIGDSNIIIHDWKSSKKIQNEEYSLESLQTKLYLFAIAKLFPDIDKKNISMKYWFPRLENRIIEKVYAEADYNSFENEICGIIEEMQKSNFKEMKVPCRECNIKTRNCFVKNMNFQEGK